MNIDYLVFFDKQLIGWVSQRADDLYLARSKHRPDRCVFHNRQQATRWVNSMHALAAGHWKGILRIVLPDIGTLHTAYQLLANDTYLFVPTDQAFVPGDKILLEFALASKRYYLVARIICCNTEPSAELPAGVGLASVFSQQLCKKDDKRSRSRG